jgi:hypothetical protein
VKENLKRRRGNADEVRVREREIVTKPCHAIKREFKNVVRE